MADSDPTAEVPLVTDEPEESNADERAFSDWMAQHVPTVEGETPPEPEEDG